MPAPAPCAGPCINTSPPAERELGSSFHSFLYSPGLSALRAPRTLCSGRSQLVEKHLLHRIRLSLGGGVREGGGRPPRLGPNAPGALPCRPSGERRISNLIFADGRAGGAAPERKKVCNLFPSAGGEPVSKFGFCVKPRKWFKKGRFTAKIHRFTGRTCE